LSELIKPNKRAILKVTFEIFIYPAAIMKEPPKSWQSALVLIFRITKVLFFGKLKDFKKSIVKKPVLFAWFLLLVPNITVALVYFAQHLQILATMSPPQRGGWCSFVAFTAIVAMISLNGSSLTIASVMYQIVRFGPKHVWRTILIGNAASWLIGFAIGFWYLKSNSLGPFRDLYCCISQEAYNGPRVILVFGFFLVSILAQLFLYTSAFFEISRCENKAKSCIQPLPRSHLLVRPSSAPEGKRSESVKAVSGTESAPSTARIFMKKGMLLVSIFYVCWFWISVDALLVFRGIVPSLTSSIIGALLAKSNAIIHCLIIHRHIRKAEKNAVYAAN